MTDRRSFLTGVSATAALGLLHMVGPASGQDAPTASGSSASSLPTNAPNQAGRWRPQHRVGFGALPIGNAFFKTVPDAQAIATVEAAWDAGVRLYDTSPSYGIGMSERRLGVVLSGKPRDEFILSTKIGRILEADPSLGVHNAGQWFDAPSFRYHYDYGADATRRSVEDSLKRLGVARLDVVFVHDLTPGNSELGDYQAHFETARNGAFPALEAMKREGLIKGWGLGVNGPESILAALEVAEPDIMLAATQYTLANHDDALEDIIPALERAGASIMVGAALHAGFLAGRDRFNYGGRPIPPAMAEKRTRLSNVARNHGVDLRVAALQFAGAHPVVSCNIPGASSPEQAIQNVEAFTARIPAQFWAELREEGLVNPKAPVPARPAGDGVRRLT